MLRTWHEISEGLALSPTVLSYSLPLSLQQSYIRLKSSRSHVMKIFSI